ncbi:hypothetical protein KP509_11G062400 [Ceratopteris richardii]|nr:hypothetical protein KP509_11G062400 [Ceratopteris richardii]
MGSIDHNDNGSREYENNLHSNNEDGCNQMMINGNLQINEIADVKENVVEILRLVPVEDSTERIKNDETECSSSFTSTESELEDRTCEVDSESRNGNGATAGTENICFNQRPKKVLGESWKNYRGGIEWRCHWLALQIRRLQAESDKYKTILEKIKSHKNYDKDGPAARTSNTSINTHHRHIFRRRKRRKAEESDDSILKMSTHPVYSRYEQQRRQREQNQQTLELDDFFDFDDYYADNIVLHESSFEHHLWHIEELQLRISNLKARLIQLPVLSEVATEHLLDLDIPMFDPTKHVNNPARLVDRSFARDFKGQGGTPSRRRNIDFDINNVIMPDSVMVNFVEPVRHAFIETPCWRPSLIPTTEEQISSDEDTDDEAYIARHERMQTMARQQQCGPLSLNKSRSVSASKERPAKNIKGIKESVANAMVSADLQEIEGGFLAFVGCIPKGKRSTRRRK